MNKYTKRILEANSEKTWVVDHSIIPDLHESKNLIVNQFNSELIERLPYNDSFNLIIENVPLQDQIGVFYCNVNILDNSSALMLYGYNNAISTCIFDFKNDRFMTNIKDKDVAIELHHSVLYTMLYLIKLANSAPEIKESHRIGTTKNRYIRNKSYTYLNITKRVQYIKEPKGTHKSPITHLRRSHIRRINRNGTICEINVKSSIVNPGEGSARSLRVLK